jgi:peptidoglycan/LPS O-acetylase OafA/YrhL
MQAASRRDIPALTGLRFLAALSVVLTHAMGKIVPYASAPPVWHALLAQLAWVGMPLFFVLSGFVIHYNYFELVRSAPVRGTAQFFVARFARLYPLFLACLAYDLAHKYGYYQLPDSTSEALPYYLTLTQAWVYRVFAGQSLIYQFGVMPQVAWSISTEWFFYCAYPFLCLLLVRRPGAGAQLGGAALLVAAAIVLVAIAAANGAALDAWAAARYGAVDEQSSFLRWLINMSPYAHFPAFVAGCVSASLFMRLRGRPVTPREARLGLALTLASLLAILLLYLVFSQSAGAVLARPLRLLKAAGSPGLAPAIALLLFCCARYDNIVVRVLSARWMIVCGAASYSLYLLHLEVIDAFRWESAPVSAPRVLITDGLRLLMTVAAAIGLSFVTYNAIELPARRWLRRTLEARILGDATRAGAAEGPTPAQAAPLPPSEPVAERAAIMPEQSAP